MAGCLIRTVHKKVAMVQSSKALFHHLSEGNKEKHKNFSQDR
jgi:hypothetical protein